MEEQKLRENQETLFNSRLEEYVRLKSFNEANPLNVEKSHDV